jgi:hypothetical protein
MFRGAKYTAENPECAMRVARGLCLLPREWAVDGQQVSNRGLSELNFQCYFPNKVQLANSRFPAPINSTQLLWYRLMKTLQ